MSMNRTILIATPLYPPDVGGPATFAKTLEAELPKWGFDVRLVKFGEVKHLPKGIRHLAYFYKLFTAALGADTILAFDPVSVGLPAYIVARLFGKKFIVRVAGDYAWEQEQGKRQNAKVKNTSQKFLTPEEFQTKKFGFVTEVRRWVERHVAKSSEKIIVPSQYLKKIVEMWGVTPEKISVIYNAFASDNSIPLRLLSDELREDAVELSEQVLGTREELRKKFGWNKKIVISAGRDVPWKGFSLLREVMKEIPEAGLFVAHTLQKKELLERIKAADLFVLNTGYEGLSHQLLEVMSIGTPIITTNVGGNPELIENGKEGILIQYNDREALKRSIMELLLIPEYSAKLARQAKEKVKQFTVEKMVRELIALLS